MKVDVKNPHEDLEEEEFFGEDPRADVEYWSKTPCWSADEATALSFGREPRIVNSMRLRGTGHPFAKVFRERKGLILRAIAMGQLQKLIPPREFIVWTRARGLPFSAELEEIERRLGSATKVTTKAEETVGLSLELEEIEGMSASAAAKKVASLRKMLLGIAVKMYSWNPQDPKRSKVASEMQGDIASVGLPLDTDTVRKHLRDAFEEFGHLLGKPDA
jgi:hypothetical protein